MSRDHFAASASTSQFSDEIAAELIGKKDYAVHGMTDVTGFGLIGHDARDGTGQQCGAAILCERYFNSAGSVGVCRAGHIPGGLNNNREFAECMVAYEAEIRDELKALLFDPQTAGGLLISVAEDDCEELVLDMQNSGIPARSIGKVTESQKPLIRIY